MSHTVKVRMIADSTIEIQGVEVYIHDIKTIIVDNKGMITQVWLKETQDRS